MVSTSVPSTENGGSIPPRTFISFSSAGRASVLWAEGHGFKPRIEQYCDLTATHQSLFKIWWSQQLLCSNSNLPKQSLLSFVYEHSTKCLLHKGKIMLYLTSNINGNVQQISLSLFMTGCGFDPRCSTSYDVGWYLWKTALFPEPFVWFCFIYASMPELVQGEALKMPCVRTRGFESHC